MNGAKSTPFSWRVRSAGLLLGLLLFFNACSVINRNSAPPAQLGHDVLLQGQGWLVCSSLCAEQGQCGAVQGQGDVILGGRTEAKTSVHDIYYPENTQVQIVAAQPYLVQRVTGGEPFSVKFYAVIPPIGEGGWVAGWCLAAGQGAP